MNTFGTSAQHPVLETLKWRRLDSRGLEISNQLLHLVLFVHEGANESQTPLRVAQSLVGASLHLIRRRRMSVGRDRK